MSRAKKGVKKPIVAAIVIAILAILAAVLVYFLVIQKPTLKVGRYSYTQKEYDALIKQAKDAGVNEQNARQAIIKSLASRAAADELKIKYPTDESSLNAAVLVQHANLSFIKKSTETEQKPDSYSEYLKLTSYPVVIEPQVRLYEKGGWKVGEVSFPFSRYIIGGWDNSDGSFNSKLVGDTTAIRQDVEYAKKKAEEYRAAYVKKEKTLDQVVAEVDADKRLTYGQASNKSSSKLITNDRTIETIYGTNDAAIDISAITQQVKNPGEATPILEELMDLTVPLAEINRGNRAVVAWYFIVLDEKIEKQSGITQKYKETVGRYSNV